jgi:hypothetical protein
MARLGMKIQTETLPVVGTARGDRLWCLLTQLRPELSDNQIFLNRWSAAFLAVPAAGP